MFNRTLIISHCEQQSTGTPVDSSKMFSMQDSCHPVTESCDSCVLLPVCPTCHGMNFIRFGVSLRRSRELTHLCSFRVTHTRNTCGQGENHQSVIHAEGVQGLSPIHPRQRRVNALRRAEKWLRTSKNASPNRLARAKSVQMVILPPLRTSTPTTSSNEPVGHFWRADPGQFSRAPKA